MKNSFIAVLTLILLSTILGQTQIDWEQINDDKPGVEPFIAVNPNSADSVVMVWYERSPSDPRHVSYSSLVRNGSSWTSVNEDTVKACPNSLLTGDPVVLYLENGSVFVSTISEDGDDQKQVYLSFCDDIWATGTPTWTAVAIDSSTTAKDKPWLSGFYNSDSSKAYLYQTYVQGSLEVWVADIVVDYGQSPPTVTKSLNELDDTNASYDSFWPTVVTDGSESIYAFWGRYTPGFYALKGNVDFMMRKKDWDESWSSSSNETIIEDVYSSESYPPENGMTTMSFPSVDYSVVDDRIALAISYWDTSGVDNHRIDIYYSDDDGDTFDSYTLTDSLKHQVIPWLTYDSDGYLSIIYNQFESDRDSVDTYINISYDGGESFPHDPILINDDINDHDDQVGTRYEYMGIDSYEDNLYCSWIKYGESDNSDGSNAVFTNWVNDDPYTVTISIDTSSGYPILSWTENDEVDFKEYKLHIGYRNPPSATVWDYRTLTTTTWSDTNFDTSGGSPDIAYYKVECIDYSGKSSGVSNTVFARGDVTHWPMRETDIVEKPTPETFNLANAYPNPFNPQTTITFDIPISCYASLKVYNMRGELVSDILSGFRMLSPGEYTRSWTPHELPSGLYILRFESKEYTSTQKVLYIK